MIKIILFTAPWCPRCHILKEQMLSKKIKFDIIDVSIHEDIAIKEEIRSLPTIRINDVKIVNPTIDMVLDEVNQIRKKGLI